MTLSVLNNFKLLLFLVVYALAVHQAASQDEVLSDEFPSDEVLLDELSSDEVSSEEVSSRSGSCRAIFNKPGACVSLRQCDPIMRLLRRRPFLAFRVIRRSICGRSFIEPRVCCPDFESNVNNGGNDGGNNSNNNNDDNNNSNNNKENNSEKPNEVQPLRPPQCGFSNKPHNRVVGGSPAEVGAWPWIANLGYGTDNPNLVVFLCGASLISSRYVLTAAHCVYGREDKNFFTRLGEYDLSSDDDGANPIDVPVEKITIHPEYDPEHLKNDIAILKLAKEVEFTDAIHPICLPVEDNIKNRNFVNNYPFVAGWGRTSTDGPSSNILRETQVPVVDEETCRNDYRNVRDVEINDRVICAGYAQGGKDACQGDSGGPLMFPQKQNYYLIGIVSGGYRCAEPNYPGLYTRVTSFLDFILSNMN